MFPDKLQLQLSKQGRLENVIIVYIEPCFFGRMKRDDDVRIPLYYYYIPPVDPPRAGGPREWRRGDEPGSKRVVVVALESRALS